MNKPTLIYDKYIASTTATANSSASGFNPSNVLEGTEDSAWKPNSPSAVVTYYLTIDLGGFRNIGSIAILGSAIDGITMAAYGSVNGFTTSFLLSESAVIDTANNATWRTFTTATCMQVRLDFTGVTSSFKIYYAACCDNVSLPYLEDGHDPDVFAGEGTHLIGTAGTFLGTTQQRSMMVLSLNFGQITAAQYSAFESWAEACVKTMKPFFYVPDIDLPGCHFGWTDAKYKFSAPYKNGLRRVAAIPFNARKI